MTRRRWTRWLRRLVLYPVLGLGAVVAGLVVFVSVTRDTPGQPQTGDLALVGATVLVGPDLEPRGATTVLVRDGVIVAVGDESEVDVPPGATVVDLGGRTLLPGLIDLHAHLGSPQLDADEEPGPGVYARLLLDHLRDVPGVRRAHLDHGVTTVRSLGDDHAWVTGLRRMLRDGELEGPRVVAAGPVFTTPGGHPVATIGVAPDSDGVRLPATPAAARDAVRALATGDGVDVVKIVQERGSEERPLEPHTPEVLAAIVAEAHEHDLPVAAHWGTMDDLDDLVTAGVDDLQHLEARGVLDGWPPGTLERLVDADVPLAPTLAVTEAATRRPGSPLTEDHHRRLRERVGELHAAGVRVVVGSDAGMPGVPFGAGLHRELELLVASGLTPQEALRGATSEAARVLRVEGIGAIEPGRAADLVAVDGDPLDDIGAVRDVAMVWRDGRLVVDRSG